MTDKMAARAALRRELEARGYRVASDTLALRPDLYLVGEGDLAKALFAFHGSAFEACEAMYQGHWPATLPPRFAVLPATEAASEALEVLTQIAVTPLFYERRDGEVVFAELDAVLAARVRGSEASSSA